MAISEGTVVEGVHCVPDSVELMPKQHDIPRARLRIVVFCPNLSQILTFDLTSFDFINQIHDDII